MTSSSEPDAQLAKGRGMPQFCSLFYAILQSWRPKGGAMAQWPPLNTPLLAAFQFSTDEEAVFCKISQLTPGFNYLICSDPSLCQRAASDVGKCRIRVEHYASYYGLLC